ncbi:HNH endonuclease [Sulfitobacter sp.]|uniref:HNH endonuclease n=1 Tax=unclassified Sulfitobacter TaxID=196795 RepID=UPI003296DC5B
MLVPRRDIIANELAEGTGATIAVRPFDVGKRKGLKLWFDDLGEKNGPVAELKPHGIKSHEVRISFGLFSAPIVAQMAQADIEELTLARSLMRSVAAVTDFSITNQSLENWTVDVGKFEALSIYRHKDLHPDSDEAVTTTCRQAIVPLMAAMAELIGYDIVENPLDSDVPEVEGGMSRATVTRRERNPRSRLLCLRIHGHICKACGMVPEEVYGIAGNIIEVHHLEPVSMLEKPRPYDPETDLVPLCPNCHRAVHSRRPWPLTLDELSSVRVSQHA